jgi:hypothetical protein
MVCLIGVMKTVQELIPRKRRKCCYIFGNGCNRNTAIPLTINGESIKRVSTFKLLGVVFSSDLAWSNHVSYVLNKISKRCYIIFQLYKIGTAQSDIVLILRLFLNGISYFNCIFSFIPLLFALYGLIFNLYFSQTSAYITHV